MAKKNTTKKTTSRRRKTYTYSSKDERIEIASNIIRSMDSLATSNEGLREGITVVNKTVRFLKNL